MEPKCDCFGPCFKLAERLILFHVAAKGWISVQCTHKISAVQTKN